MSSMEHRCWIVSHLYPTSMFHRTRIPGGLPPRSQRSSQNKPTTGFFDKSPLGIQHTSINRVYYILLDSRFRTRGDSESQVVYRRTVPSTAVRVGTGRRDRTDAHSVPVRWTPSRLSVMPVTPTTSVPRRAADRTSPHTSRRRRSARYPRRGSSAGRRPGSLDSQRGRARPHSADRRG